jgi:hypothetical protein
MKLVMKLVADRVGDVLVRHPEYMHPAQRAFLKEGYLGQSLDLVVDVLEDWNEHKRHRGSPMFLLAYDVAKAYDSVQAVSIRAALERFNLPPLCIELVLSGLDNACSRVRTNGGLTAAFRLGSSVRQGDPFAPLVYAMLTDSLHAGFDSNPLFPPERVSRWGYKFARGFARDCTSGYADDTALMSEDSVALAEMHAWVRVWHGAHFLRLNVSKTKLLCSNVALAPPIPSVDGRSLVAALPDRYTIRYLGLWINLRLRWEEQIAVTDRAVWSVCDSIRAHGFDLEMARVAV